MAIGSCLLGRAPYFMQNYVKTDNKYQNNFNAYQFGKSDNFKCRKYLECALALFVSEICELTFIWKSGNLKLRDFGTWKL